MKKTIIFFLLGLFLQAQLPLEAQILKNISKKVKRKVDQTIDKTINKGVDEAEDAVTGKKADSLPGDNKTEEKELNSDTNINQGVLRPWSNYDFVPGEIIIFEDILEGEINGEFPSQWDLVDGYVENASFSGENIIRFPIENSGATITPLIKKESDYLPEKFTIEFDMYLSSRTSKYWVYLWDKRKSSRIPPELGNIAVIEVGYEQGASYDKGKIRKKLPEESKKAYPHWRHVAISFNIRALKVYIDQDRLIMIPNAQGNPLGFSIKGSTYDSQQTGNYPTLIKNIRIAEGAVELYDRLLTDGKIISNGIKFDSGKATLKPESMGVINEIVNLMNQHAYIKFSIEGHTDSDGDSTFNKNLSEQRANTVKVKLIDMGIAGDRLESKGFGEDKPVVDNNTPEGKANNRRVEFVKM